jgi:hypothetical protein
VASDHDIDGLSGRQIESRLKGGAADMLNRLGTTVLRGSRADAPIGPPDKVYERHGAMHPGALRRSGRRSRATATRLRTVIEFPIEHAGPQHEREDYDHPQGGKAHYLSDWVKAVTPLMAPGLAEMVRRRLDG